MFCDAAKNMQKLKRLSEFSALLQEISHSLRIAQRGFSTIDGSKAFEIFTHLIASQKTIAEKHRVLDKFFPHSSLSRYDFAVSWLQFLKKDPKLVNEKDFFLNFAKRRAQSIGDNFRWATPSLENLLNYCELLKETETEPKINWLGFDKEKAGDFTKHLAKIPPQVLQVSLLPSLDVFRKIEDSDAALHFLASYPYDIDPDKDKKINEALAKIHRQMVVFFDVHR